MRAVLDSWAILRFLEDREPAASAVAGLLAEQKPIVSWINLGEVFYILRRRAGERDALAAVRDLQEVVVAEVPTSDRIMQAARIKADHPMAYADAFAAATAVSHQSPLWTGDPELLLPFADWAWRDLR
ncbi:PIN domain-containing protein [Candidatus Poriferisocius sp.]|uniref:PIN domain-containing protein n=1 Tax=Candidatus Poriferisocius sp. TaxID=3101276 RepID=UPI003B51F9B3